MTSAAQVRAALDALFDSPSPLPMATPPPTPPANLDVPRNLDAVIEADTATPFEVETHRWFAGRDATGIVRIFRFQRGQALADWHDTLHKQRLVSVAGPYRNQIQAQRGR